jgi:hypothetical protein
MKRFYFMIAVLTMLLAGTAFSQNVSLNFPDARGGHGFHIADRNQAGLRIVHAVPNLVLNDFAVEGQRLKMVDMPGVFLPNTEGAPNLPGNGRYVAVPKGTTPTLIVHQTRKEIIENIDFLPAPNIPMANEDEPLVYIKDASIYEKNAFYPAEPFVLSEVTSVRGVDMAMLGITPFQYNPVTKQLIIYYDVEVEVVFDGGSSEIGDSRLRSRWWDPIIKDALINADMLPEVNYSQRFNSLVNNRSTGAEYLVIVPDNADFISWGDSIRLFRNRQGIKTQVVTTTEIGGNDHNLIKSYLVNAYNNWDIPPVAVLLLGDYGSTGNTITSQYRTDHPYGGSSAYVSDNFYADISGNNMPDIVMARITARTPVELQIMVNKFLQYERNPPINQHFYDNPITAMGWQTERWFQICSETVNGFWEYEMDKTPLRQNNIYSGAPGNVWSTASNTATVVSTFGPLGLGYIPQTPAHLNSFGWGANANSINQAINAGAFMVMHRDHGLETGWGEPHYRNEHLSGLNNDDLTFVFSINCLTGKFNWTGGESFTEAMHRHPKAALGLTAASEISYSFVNDTYVWGMMDNMWPQFLPDYGTNPPSRDVLPAFANAAGKYFLQQSNWPYNPQHKMITYYLFHHHGDAFSTVYAQMPVELSVNHLPAIISTMTEVEVTANAGALIALTVNNEIIGVGEGTGSAVPIPVSQQLPGDNILITVTLQDHFRYEAVIDVIPPEGPYVVSNATIISDDQGNNNGIIDFGEIINLGVELKNIGVETATEIYATLSTAMPYVTFIEDEQSFGDIEPNQTNMIDNAYSFVVNDDIPNNTQLEFILEIEDTENSWTSHITMTAYSPEFNVSHFAIGDFYGNANRRLDPGETANISVFVKNNGGSNAPDAVANLVLSDPFITVHNSSHEFGTFVSESTRNAIFSVTASPETPPGYVLGFDFIVESGNYSASQSFNLKVGIIVEDFETGDFTNFDWVFSGQQPWQITTVNPYENTYSAKSGAISHNQQTRMGLEYESGVHDTISFFRRVSSESNYDHLRFYINGEQKGQWSGNVGWGKVSFPVEAGTNLFIWEYMKDNLTSSGEDAAWVDFISLPAPIITSGWAGNNAEICESETLQLEAQANHYESLEWSSTGDGSFDDPTILNPVYTPGNDDISGGETLLTLTVTGENNTIIDELMLAIHQSPAVSIIADAAVCYGEVFEVTNAEAAHYDLLVWESNGTGMFNDASALQPVYSPSIEDYEAGSVVLTLWAHGFESCEPAQGEIFLQFNALPSALLAGEQEICLGEEAMLSVELSGTAPWELTLANDMGSHSIEASPWEWQVSPDITTVYALAAVTDANGCTADATDEVTVHLNYAPDPPLQATGMDTIDLFITSQTVYLIEEVEQANAYTWQLQPEEAGTMVMNGLQLTVDWDVEFRGQALITAQAENNCGLGEASPALEIELYSTVGLSENAMLEASIFPNPSEGYFTITMHSFRKTEAMINIRNMMGELVYTETFALDANKLSKTLNIKHLSSGNYILSLESNDGLSIKRIVIQK